MSFQQTLREQILIILETEKRFITKKELCTRLAIKGAKRRDLKLVLINLKKEGLYGKKDAVVIDKPVRVVKAILDKSEKPKFGLKKPVKQKIFGKCGLKVKDSKATIVGLLTRTSFGGKIESTNRKAPFPPIRLTEHEIEKAELTLSQKNDSPEHFSDNDLVAFRLDVFGHVVIEHRIGNLSDPKIFSLMAIYSGGVPFEFSDAAIKQANKGAVPPLENRFDYRATPFVTIDGEDARDFDDAVFAKSDTDPNNPGGWIAMVAIADVSYYVRPFDALDLEAYERGNSIYFPDRVVPMLPEALSNEICSLKPHEDRACLVAEMVISNAGDIVSYTFKRGLMRSVARLTYTQVQRAIDAFGSSEDEKTSQATHPAAEVESKEFWQDILAPLYGTYKSLRKARDRRGSLDLDSVERKVVFDDQGKIIDIVPRIQQVSNALIEEFMIAANVAAAKTLSAKKWPVLYRVHDKPDETRVENMRRIVGTLGLKVEKTKSTSTASFNHILNQKTPFKRMLHELVLRSQAQAVYAPENIGHFGLSLSHYTHFTSPIRRYSDLLVHRALIESLSLGEGGQEKMEMERLKLIGEHISTTERTAAQLEREVMDRYLVLHLEDYIGATFEATIVGVTVAGIFFELDQSGAQGFIHKSNLPGDYYIFDENNHQYIGKRTHKSYQLGARLLVILDTADARTRATTFVLAQSDDEKKYHFSNKTKGNKMDDQPLSVDRRKTKLGRKGSKKFHKKSKKK